MLFGEIENSVSCNTFKEKYFLNIASVNDGDFGEDTLVKKRRFFPFFSRTSCCQAMLLFTYAITGDLQLAFPVNPIYPLCNTAYRMAAGVFLC